MRAFEFHVGELDERNAESTVIDLDSVVMVQKNFFDGPDGPPKWVVTLASNTHLFVTETAFNRILLAWKSE
jgi:hypothetical protein